jgi:hypothetical protein
MGFYGSTVMKIQIDTVGKTLTIEEDVNLDEFYNEINTLLPGGLWREFTLKITKITEWKDPIVLPNTDPYNPFNTPGTGNPPYPTTPGTSPYPGIPQIWYTTTGTDTVTNGDYRLNQGVFNVVV